MKILITGGAGFIGSHMVDCLLQHGYAVRVIDNLMGGSFANLLHCNNLDFWRQDIRKLKDDEKFFSDARYLFHFAGIGDIVPSIEHPREYMDVIMYTGFGYSGRDLLFVRASDAMIIGPGRIGTLNEFAVAYEDHRPMGILEGNWDTDELIKMIMDSAHRPNPSVIFDSDPKAMVERLIEMVIAYKHDLNLVYDNHDGWSGTGKNADVIL